MLDQDRKGEIDEAVLRSADVFRGYGDPIESVSFTMALLLLKYLSDVLLDEPRKEHKAMEDARFIVPEKADFYRLLSNAREPGNGNRLNQALAALQSANYELKDAFLGIDFDSIVLGNETPKDRALGSLLHALNCDALDFRPVRDGAKEAAAWACDAVLTHASSNSGKRGGEFFTTPQISRLMARLMRPVGGERISDPFCGVASTLIACNEYALKSPCTWGCSLYGQEANGSTLSLARMSMILHGETHFRLEWGDTLRNPKLVEANGDLIKFQVVVSHPPFSVRDWGHEDAERDGYRRFWRGVPPRTSGDYAYISHMVETLASEVGRMAVLVPLGVLFRGAAELQIRKQFIEENLVDAVIGLPAKMLSYTSIPLAILILRKNKSGDDVLFIDASRDFQPGKIWNTLRDADLDRIEQTYDNRQSVERYATLVSRTEIEANEYNLNVARYVEIAEDEEQIDLAILRAERAQLKTELETLEARLTQLREWVGHV